MHLTITDMEGREILSRSYDLKNGLHTIPLDLSQLAAGAYQIVFNDGNSQSVKKFFKVK